MNILVHSSTPIFQRVRKLLRGNGAREIIFVSSMEELKRDCRSHLVFIEMKGYDMDTLCRCVPELKAACPVLLTDREVDWNRMAGVGASGFISVDSGDKAFAVRMEAAVRRFGYTLSDSGEHETLS